MYIKSLDEQTRENCANYTIYFAYQKSKEIGHDLLDFADLIWSDDVAKIVTTLKKNNVQEFTISYNSSCLIDRLADFEKLGCKINGLTKIKTTLKNLDGSIQEANALKMRIL